MPLTEGQNLTVFGVDDGFVILVDEDGNKYRITQSAILHAPRSESVEGFSHTSLPWFSFGNNHCIGGPHSVNETAGVAMCSMRLRTPAENKANVQFILRACNSHYAMRGACEAVLLFHSASPWDSNKQTNWFNLTQQLEVTTKVLCDHVRKSIEILSENETLCNDCGNLYDANEPCCPVCDPDMLVEEYPDEED